MTSPTVTSRSQVLRRETTSRTKVATTSQVNACNDENSRTPALQDPVLALQCRDQAWRADDEAGETRGDELDGGRRPILRDDHEKGDEKNRAEVRQCHAGEAAHLGTRDDDSQVQRQADEQKAHQGGRGRAGKDVEIVPTAHCRLKRHARLVWQVYYDAK